MLQSSAFDLVLGLDLHVVTLLVAPALAPVPTPIPLPFVGLVFDPLGLAAGAAISLAMRGGPGLVLVNGMPVTNCGSAVTNALTMPHAAAPGVLFMRNGLPELEGDAELYFGSLKVSLAGSYGVRLGDVALGCSDPNRLPTSVVLAIPKGRPVLNMAPMAPDLVAIATAGAMKRVVAGLAALARRGASLLRALRQHSRFAERLSRRLGGCHPPANASRWRQQWHRGVRFVTGHPVDVVTGGMFTEALELALPGPIPLRIERVYATAGSATRSSLGHGWRHTLDESLWFERGRAVVQLGDGRELEFGLWDLPGRHMRPGDAVERLIHALRLVCVAEQYFELEFADGRVHAYAPIPGDACGRLRLVSVHSFDRCHSIELGYDPRGRLTRVCDACGRVSSFTYDSSGRLAELWAPHPSGAGRQLHRRYSYDAADDLVEVVDALGHAWRYAYEGHLMVRETDRSGLSFYFEYDGVGSPSSCVRTWGDDGIYDHVISYDPRHRKTIVENSHREVTVYAYNERNQVTAVTDALGQTTRYDYDPSSGGQTLHQDALGACNQRHYDERGDLVGIVAADGGRTSRRYAGHRPTHERDARGGEWRWRYDPGGRLTELVSPAGRRVRQRWDAGLLVAIEEGEGRETLLSYDDHKQLILTTLADGADLSYRLDGRGRVVERRDPDGGVTRFLYDLEDRLVGSQSPAQVDYELRYDPEGELVEASGDGRLVRFEYAQHRRPVAQHEAGASLRWAWDREGRLRAVTNEAGERFELGRDGAGRIVAETGFDGRTRRFTLDGVGRRVVTVLASGRTRVSSYDGVGRLLELRNDDDSFMRLGYEPGGLLCSADNESARVQIERDADGHVIVERVNGAELRSTYDAAGERIELRSSAGARAAIQRTVLGEPAAMFIGETRGHQAVADVSLAHAPGGRLRSLRHANGIELSWAHDDAGRAVARRILSHHRGGGIELLDRIDYSWRGDTRLERGGDRGLQYDARGRVVAEQRGDARHVRAFDAVGSVYQQTDHGDRRYGPGARLEQLDGHAYAHDEDGNQTSRSTAEGDWAYRWNGHGLLTAIERSDGARVEFEYDAFARRIGKRLFSAGGVPLRQTTFVWDGHVPVDEIDSVAGRTTWHWLPDTATPILKEHAGRRFAVASDLIGTPTHLFDEAGQTCWRANIDLFGRVEVEVGDPSDCPWRSPGQYDDGFQDELYNRCRYYSPTRGSYISRDPAGLQAGYHAYTYVPDPLTWFDLLGLTGTYLFSFDGGLMYIGKGPVKRSRGSQRQRAGDLDIDKGAHMEFGDNRMGLMVEADLMARYGFGDNDSLLNAINSPGRKMLIAATPAQRRTVRKHANALDKAYQASQGGIC